MIKTKNRVILYIGGSAFFSLYMMILKKYLILQEAIFKRVKSFGNRCDMCKLKVNDGRLLLMCYSESDSALLYKSCLTINVNVYSKSRSYQYEYVPLGWYDPEKENICS